MPETQCRMAFYGDDFTGSTDALEVLAFAGWRCALFLKPPSVATLARFGDLDAVGVAGDSRGMSPPEMDEHLPSVFRALAALGVPIIHYKVCSTFDSSPAIGSIGRVIEIARKIFPGAFVPIVAGTPELGRYCVFGNLFARSGTDGQIYRIDRHPIMRVHPVTPMGEADLAVHLAHQGDLAIVKFTYRQLEDGRAAADAQLAALACSDADAILFDSTSAEHLTEVGRLLVGEAQRRAPVFVVGSSGAEYALTQWWQEVQGGGAETDRFGTFEPVDRILIVSGSASKLTALQIGAALQTGFADLPVDARDVVDDERWATARSAIVARAVAFLDEGRSVVLHTARGPDDPRIAAMIDGMLARGIARADAKLAGGRTLGVRLGCVVRDILAATPLRRPVFSGGDTSSQVTQVLGPDALEVVARLAPGAPLCRTLSQSPHLHGIEIALKGGQMGDERFFLTARAGNR
jgi:3-oxoisoapionate kinase